jgi:hypothetical protein
MGAMGGRSGRVSHSLAVGGRRRRHHSCERTAPLIIRETRWRARNGGFLTESRHKGSLHIMRGPL